MPTSEPLNSKLSTFDRLCEIVAQLRAPDGCPWDREQTHESLLPALIEEAYEVAGAVRAKDDANFREELGDLLLLIVMHAEIAQETGRFKIDSVIGDVTEKLIRRHPHVFGKSDARDSGAVLKQWANIILMVCRQRCRPWCARKKRNLKRRESISTGASCAM